MKIRKIKQLLDELRDAKATLALAEGLRDLALYNIQIEKLRTTEVKLSSCPSYIRDFHVKYGKGHCSLSDYVRRYRIDAERRGMIHRIVWL